jgi:hypothetical protein
VFLTSSNDEKVACTDVSAANRSNQHPARRISFLHCNALQGNAPKVLKVVLNNFVWTRFVRPGSPRVVYAWSNENHLNL